MNFQWELDVIVKDILDNKHTFVKYAWILDVLKSVNKPCVVYPATIEPGFIVVLKG